MHEPCSHRRRLFQKIVPISVVYTRLVFLLKRATIPHLRHSILKNLQPCTRAQSIAWSILESFVTGFLTSGLGLIQGLLCMFPDMDTHTTSCVWLKVSTTLPSPSSVYYTVESRGTIPLITWQCCNWCSLIVLFLPQSKDQLYPPWYRLGTTGGTSPA